VQLGAGLTDRDLDFIVDHAAPGSGSRDGLKRLIVEDDDFRKAMVGDERVFLAVTSDDDILLKLSPHLYFEVLLRRAHSDIDSATHTLERTGRDRVPVFDAREVSTLLDKASVLVYLADMLASFTRVHSYVVPIRRRRGIRRKVRYSDMDLDSLIAMCASADEDGRFAFYKRIADLCLFVTGIFPGSASRPTPGEIPGRRRIGRQRGVEEYEREGVRFYGLAEGHPAATTLGLAEVFGLLREEFTSARKPLTYIAGQHLHSSGRKLFGAAV
jgi:hypothetical protein